MAKTGPFHVKSGYPQHGEMDESEAGVLGGGPSQEVPQAVRQHLRTGR